MLGDMRAVGDVYSPGNACGVEAFRATLYSGVSRNSADFDIG